MGAKIDDPYKYAAFISYAHADEVAAKKLHVALETYPLPKGMGKAQRNKLFPIFRDVTELTAHHSLSEKIRDAVKASRFLIVLCSPAAQKSHWVNEEIQLFRKLHGEGSILAVIVDGVPDTAFPPALTADGREPLAANMATKEGFRFGVTQLAASMLGVGLDKLVQRDQKRRRLRTQFVTGVSTALTIIMGGLAWTAIDARDDAEVALGKAEVSRNAAEEMVEFLIGDLKNDLTPIQKLDLFDGIGKRVADYYDDIPLEDMDDDRMMRRARSLHILGDVEISRGNYEEAEHILREAYLITEDVYIRNPDNTTAIFAHAQSEYWIGALYFKQDKFEKALPHWKAYDDYSQRLAEADPENIDMLMEAGWGKSNVALFYLRMEDYAAARPYYIKSIALFEAVLKIKPLGYVKAELANSYTIAMQGEYGMGNKESAIHYNELALSEYSNLYRANPNNRIWRFRQIQSNFRLLKRQRVKSCSNTNFLSSLNNIEKLLQFDPDNQEWREEFLIQLNHRIFSCINNKNFDAAKPFVFKFEHQIKLAERNEVINSILEKMDVSPEYQNLKSDLK